ncbi:MAG: DUF3379 family protein [Alteromonadaceae bacterium]|nr:DUF3379 family protein [Alteromonadaceae bacterium]
MNDAEFRQALLVEPFTSDSTVTDKIEGNAELEQLQSEYQAFDKNLRETAQVDVPEGLMASLMNIPLQQETVDESTSSQSEKVVPITSRKRNNFVQLALAASVAFALGLSFTMLQNQPVVETGTEIALAHVYHEADYAMQLDGNVSLEDVNAKLATFGGELMAKFGRVTFANYCFFEKQKSLHMVVETDFGKVTMFITPKDLDRAIDNSFSDDKYEGSSWSMQTADLTIISDKEMKVADKHEKLLKHFRFSA